VSELQHGDSAPPSIFGRVACAIDGSPEALEGARQAVRLAPTEASIVLLGAPAAQALESVSAGSAFPPPPLDHRAEARERLEQAVHALGQAPGIETRLLAEPVIPTLLQALVQERATLAAAGSHGHRRSTGILIGSVATALLHDAPCSVLLARLSAEPERFPHSIAVGFDGSAQSERALSVGRELAGRLAVPLRIVIAGGGKQSDARVEEAVRAGVARHDIVEDRRGPVDALTDAGVDLLVIGSRGLHGLRALGSVSERVAHRAPCSVLVVRP
jgi:nucleotide-binding universal stress UspA family protein